MIEFIALLLVGLVADVDTRPSCYTCHDLRRSGHSTSGIYNVYLPSGMKRVFCEMGINGGGYTFISNSLLPRLSNADIRCLFRRSSDVLLRISKPDGTQPYTIITQYRATGGLRVYLNGHTGTSAPVNRHIGPYIYLDTLPNSVNRVNHVEGIKVNGKAVTFRKCAKTDDNSYFAFFYNSFEKTPSSYLKNNLVYERQGVSVNWRKNAIRPPSGRRLPLNYFFFTEMHYGGCGTYTSSDRWLRARYPALGTAIGLR
ncbi:uncharacterized protein LOC130625956 [Hydractinia symbiolongicarpus]|uniref:uncharacterized protein LOC130625461 n=1 Tax=Hydractinia symbiolongicarpus TaxID=13093 RepID=UPI00254C3AF9|nr:uncharacterized protein LOC130625461 [Hydractinia symbiolongicarpus]XP_057296547.1 uncharacterized protein LOC130625462 [Hydractinia symbiolongicarpus]XP_057296923.1 uncharacterized protein LOC130625824 [Hydractinia symbiolongicarpus]XP_057297063.1 uncharacterized protein LOC130625956 [Hydractinia symbiolongicarpus]